MKQILLLLLLSGSAFAQVFNIDPTPSINDKTEFNSLKKINKILNDARAGTAPLSTASAAQSTAAPVTTAGTLSTTAASVLAVNASRKESAFRNIDASIDVYVGPTGVTSANGFLVKAGEIYLHRTTAALFAVAASGTPAYRTITEQ